ncbi:MAG: sigma-70 family RNA polymerase sigma factor [Caulobacteraceae bacterium]
MTASDKAERFERLVGPHLDAAHNLAGWLTGDAADAADLVQDAFLRAFRFFDQLRGDSIKPWLLTILRNTHYSRLKAARRAPPVTSLDAAEAEVAIVAWAGADGEANDPETLLLRMEDRDLIRRAVADLPEEQRTIVVLREAEGLAYKDLAEVLDIPLGTVMSRLARARKVLAVRVARIRQEADREPR